MKSRIVNVAYRESTDQQGFLFREALLRYNGFLVLVRDIYRVEWGCPRPHVHVVLLEREESVRLAIESPDQPHPDPHVHAESTRGEELAWECEGTNIHLNLGHLRDLPLGEDREIWLHL